MGITNAILSYLSKTYSSDHGLINFFSGIMVATSVNTLTGFCSSENASIFLLFCGVSSLISSLALFFLYQLLSRIQQTVEDEISQYNVQLSPNDLNIQRKLLWKKNIYKNGNSILFYFTLAFLFGVVVLLVFLVGSFIDTNSIKILIIHNHFSA